MKVHQSQAEPDLQRFDVILLNSSAGKDSMATLDFIATAAARQGILDRVVVGHADLGRVEWPGARTLAEHQADRYDLRFEVVAPRGLDLLQRVERRGMWPSARQRWCTSDLKRGPLRRLMTQLVAEFRSGRPTRRVRLLNVMGMRAQESPARARQTAVAIDARASNGRREVTNYLPLHKASTADVWRSIGQSPISDLIHPAYDLGMPRLSCRFCILASKGALVRAAVLNPDLARDYLRVEKKTRHRFRQDFSMQEIVDAADRSDDVPITPWIG